MGFLAALLRALEFVEMAQPEEIGSDAIESMAAATEPKCPSCGGTTFSDGVKCDYCRRREQEEEEDEARRRQYEMFTPPPSFGSSSNPFSSGF